MTTLLEIRHLTKSFGGVHALDNVSLSLAEGMIMGLMGANGAGKTTLFGIVAGHLRPTSGDVRYRGTSIVALRPDQICRRGICRTFQIVRPFSGLSVRQSVATAALFGAEPAATMRAASERAEQILDLIGLGDRADTPAEELTLSAQKKLEVARALATGCRLLLLDEVLAGCTAAEVTEMLDVLRRIHRERSLTILIIEHVMRALMRFADRIAVLHHGELIAEGTPAQIAEDPRVHDAYLGSTP
ncbi:MAG TPA: ABC transporter ATP-binding protein [Alphaproteobacteria bacterium]|nr:ABC transporter ATP-binding protein [Alphaproteobacteria bacterium]